ncbi:(2Fe-2S)-binding protein [Antarctobacter heliothermus]|nr:(2Fe-2S)-binding protein [Antarctobacter heliothermus]
MMNSLRVGQADRGAPFEISVDGRSLRAYSGETVAGVLMSNGITIFRRTQETGRPRGQFCGMGVCFDCLVQVDGAGMSRACMTEAQPGMHVSLKLQDVKDAK